MAALRGWLWLHRVRGRAGGALTAAQSPRLKTARSDFAPTISTICRDTSTVYRTPAIGSRFCRVGGWGEQRRGVGLSARKAGLLGERASARDTALGPDLALAVFLAPCALGPGKVLAV